MSMVSASEESERTATNAKAARTAAENAIIVPLVIMGRIPRNPPSARVIKRVSVMSEGPYTACGAAFPPAFLTGYIFFLRNGAGWMHLPFSSKPSRQDGFIRSAFRTLPFLNSQAVLKSMYKFSRSGGNLTGRPDSFLIKIGAAAIALLFVLVCFVLLNTESSSAEADGGTYGNLTWEYDGDHTLTISGEGAMPDPHGENYPWIYYRGYVTTLVIGNGVTSIADDAFYYFNSLTDLTIGNTVVTIGERAFYCCSITSLTLPNSLVSIGDQAFFNTDLTSLVIPNNVTSIGEGAFYDVPLESLTLGSSLEIIGKEAFYDAEFTTLVIPDSVTSIGDSAF
jgi:hypothetical protein